MLNTKMHHLKTQNYETEDLNKTLKAKPSSPNDLLHGISDMFVGSCHDMFADANLDFSDKPHNGWNLLTKTIFNQRSPRQIILSEQLQQQKDKEEAERQKQLELIQEQKRAKKERKFQKRKDYLARLSFNMNETSDLGTCRLNLNANTKLDTDDLLEQRYSKFACHSPVFSNRLKLPSIGRSQNGEEIPKNIISRQDDIIDKIQTLEKMKNLLVEKLKINTINEEETLCRNSAQNRSRKYTHHSPDAIKTSKIKFQFPLKNRVQATKAFKEDLVQPSSAKIRKDGQIYNED